MEEIKVGKISIPIIEGKQGIPGKEGTPGKPGDDGYSPVKGVDYFTPDEIEDVIGEVTTRAKENLEYEFRENLKDISYDNTTGILTFTRYDGTTAVVDLPLELIVSSGTYNDTTKEIELTLANGQLIKIPLSDLIDDFYTKSEIDTKVNTINGELTNLKTEDSKLQETLTNQEKKIEELEEENKQLLKDHKPIPFNAVSSHLVDTGELPMPISINGGIEQNGEPSIESPVEVKGVSGHYDNVVSNKNELNPTLQTTTLNGITCTRNDDKTYTLNGTATAQTIFSVKTITLDTSETYTLSGCPSGGNGNFFIAGANFTDYGDGSIATPSRSDITFSIVVQKGTTCNNLLFKPMLEKSTVKTDYTPHQEQLLPIDIPFNMYSGKAYKENGKWYRKVEWFEKVFNGTETFSVSSYSNEDYLCVLTYLASGKYAIKQNSKTTYCNCLPLGVYTDTKTKECIGNNEKSLNLKILISRLSENSVTGLQAFLKELYDNGTPIKVLYQLAEPYEEEITDTTLIKQLEDMQKAHSYYEVTNINSYSNGGADLVLSGNALMSNDIRLSKLESALVSLGGI